MTLNCSAVLARWLRRAADRLAPPPARTPPSARDVDMLGGPLHGRQLKLETNRLDVPLVTGLTLVPSEDGARVEPRVVFRQIGYTVVPLAQTAEDRTERRHVAVCEDMTLAELHDAVCAQLSSGLAGWPGAVH